MPTDCRHVRIAVGGEHRHEGSGRQAEPLRIYD